MDNSGTSLTKIPQGTTRYRKVVQGTARWYKVPPGCTRWHKVPPGSTRSVSWYRKVGKKFKVTQGKIQKTTCNKIYHFKKECINIQIYMGEHLTKTSPTVVHGVKWVKVNALPIYFWSKVSKTSYALDRQHL